ncbi:MAG TPA: hypothetical protein DCM28_08155 [Phycisphaerales bacterium]|nr:hypothetical protein [Phycisphaerales bacterium]HCD34937.1 hypothetical protein [Phycisphaerales bacterium]
MNLIKRLLLPLVLLVSVTMTQAQVTVYVDPVKGNDTYDGQQASPVKTFKQAVKMISDSGGTMHLALNSIFAEPMQWLGHDDTAPVTVMGNAATIDLGTDISAGPWIPDGDGYIYAKPVPRHVGNAPWQMANVYINNQPITAYDPRFGKAPKPGQLQHLPEDRLRIVLPQGLSISDAKIILNPDYKTSCVAIRRGNITIRDLNVRHGGNDGFNIHGQNDNVELRNVTAMFCGDEGISAHGQTRMNVYDSIIAFNGSQAGGVADVNQSSTTYTRCASLYNRGHAFYFDKGEHVLTDCLVGFNAIPWKRMKADRFTNNNVIEMTDDKPLENLPWQMEQLYKQCQALRQAE